MPAKHPKIFGKRPILMQRYDGGLRIINTDGKVEYLANYYSNTPGWLEISTFVVGNTKGCTSATTQEEAYNNCLVWDQEHAWLYSNEFTAGYAAFLGYL